MTTAHATADVACSCENCAGLRDSLVALARSRKLPEALVHDDGQPVMIEVSDTAMTLAEARLRLALADTGAADEIRDLINRLRNRESGRVGAYDDPVRKAAKLLAKLNARSKR